MAYGAMVDSKMAPHSMAVEVDIHEGKWQEGELGMAMTYFEPWAVGIRSCHHLRIQSLDQFCSNHLVVVFSHLVQMIGRWSLV